MTERAPNFSVFPFARLRRVTARAAALESAVARWIAARPAGAGGGALARLCGGPVALAVGGVVEGAIEGGEAVAAVRIGGAAIRVEAPGAVARALAQRLLGGPEELAAPRPIGAVEQAIWALAVAAALEDAGVAGEVLPLGADRAGPDAIGIAIAAALPWGPATIVARVPAAVTVRPPPPRPLPGWAIEAAIVVARCAIPREAAGALAVRDVITVEGGLALVIGDGAIGLRAAPGAIEATVATGYVPRDMGLPDDAHLELTVQLGTARIPLRRVAELAVGEIVALGRPLAGPYEVRAAGELIGHGELIDIDGELGVRIVALRSRPAEE